MSFSSVQFLFLKSVVKEVYKKEIKHYFKSYHEILSVGNINLHVQNLTSMKHVLNSLEDIQFGSELKTEVRFAV